MAGEWHEDSVGAFFDLVTGYAFKSEEFRDGGAPVIKIKNIKAGHFSKHEFSYVSEQFLTELANKRARHNDLLISMSGNRHDGSPETWVGKVALFKEPDDYLINQRVGALRLKHPGSMDERFASYVLSSFPYQELFIAIATSSGGQANLSPGQILGATVRYPEIKTQRAIAHILGALDDKIELNRRMNETLEEMARALFKSWFVDFDPVCAKAAGRDPGLPKHIVGLFPDSFEDSELGEIPKGWAIQPIGDFIERLSVGQKYEQKTVSAAGKVPVLDQGKSGIIGYHDDDPGIVASEEEPVVVFANHTCYMRLIPFSFSAIQNVLPFIGKGVDTVWAFYATYGKQSFIEYKGHWPDLIIQKSITPCKNLTVEFSKLIHPFIKQVWKKENESRTLARLRDALLPKLISGELRIKDAERFLKERGL